MGKICRIDLLPVILRVIIEPLLLRNREQKEQKTVSAHALQQQQFHYSATSLLHPLLTHSMYPQGRSQDLEKGVLRRGDIRAQSARLTAAQPEPEATLLINDVIIAFST